LRTYTAPDIIKLTEIMRSSGEVTEEQIAGMDRLGQLLMRLRATLLGRVFANHFDVGSVGSVIG